MPKHLHPSSNSCHTHELPFEDRFATSLPRRKILLHSLGAAFIMLANRPADALGQSPNLKTSLNPSMLRRSSFLWTQAEREYGFAHWDQVFSGRIVETNPNPNPHPLPTGLAIDQFLDAQPDGSGCIENFIAQNKVAGLIILHKGKIRSEHYAARPLKDGPMDLAVNCQIHHQHTRRSRYPRPIHRWSERPRHQIYPRPHRQCLSGCDHQASDEHDLWHRLERKLRRPGL